MSESHDPVKDAVKHLFGLDKKEQENQAAQPVEQAQPAEQSATQPQENPAGSLDWSQVTGAAANLANQASQQMPSPQPSPTLGNPFADNPQPVATPSNEEAHQTVESEAQAHEDVPPVPEPAPVAANPDVESINGHAVGFAFLRYYKAHPEIGQPVDEQHGDVGGYQMFEHAILHWDGSNVQVENRDAQNQGGGQRTYTVSPGDNLTAIAQQLYGDGNQWHRIYDANRDKISNPDLIHPGQELVIP